MLSGLFLLGLAWSNGHAHYRLAQRLPNELVGQTVLITAQIVDIAQATQFGQRLLIRPLKPVSDLAWQPDRLQLSINDRSTLFSAGEIWEFKAKLKPVYGQINPAGFDLEAWFLQQNIAAQASAKQYSLIATPSFWQRSPFISLQRLRQYCLRKIEHDLPQHPQRSVIKALSVGEQSEISAEQWWGFSQTGTTHLISISGLHITMLSGLVAAIVFYLWRAFPALIRKLPAQKAAILSGVLAAIAYFLISGMAIPSQRTVLMLIIFSGALWYQVKIPLSVCWLTALSMVLLLDPFAALSIGFWLSFLSVGFLFWACSNRIATTTKWREYIHSQWAASLGMLPLLILIFGQYPQIAPVANTFAIPVISFLVTPLSLVGLLDPSGIALRTAAQLMTYCDLALQYLLQAQISTWQHAIPPFWMIPAALLAVLIILLPRGLPARYIGWVLLCPLLFYRPEPVKLAHFRAVILDVGQGLSVLVQTQQHALLFDTGAQPNLDRVILPALRSFNLMHLDQAIFSHNDNDHIGGAARLLQRWPIDLVQHSLPATQALLQDNPNQAFRQCRAGEHWTWDGIRFEILWPTADFQANNDNARGCVLRISNAKHSLLIPADIGKREEAQLLHSGLQTSDILIVPHHGSKTSSSAEFIAAIQPRYAVFSAGFMNRFGHPKAEIRARYQQAHANELISYQLGAIYFEVGDEIQLKVERQIHPHYWYTKLQQ